MTKTILLNTIEKEFQQEIEKTLQTENILTADTVIELSKKLFSVLKPKDISSKANEDDMLLFQYGTYNWGGLLGEHPIPTVRDNLSKYTGFLIQIDFTPPLE